MKRFQAARATSALLLCDCFVIGQTADKGVTVARSFRAANNLRQPDHQAAKMHIRLISRRQQDDKAPCHGV